MHIFMYTKYQKYGKKYQKLCKKLTENMQILMHLSRNM